MEKKTIVLDTNILLAVAQFKVDIFTEIDRICDFPYVLAVVTGTLDELNKLKKTTKKGKDKAAASLAAQLLVAKNVKVINLPSETVDDALAELSNHLNAMIVTQDKELKKRLKRPYMTLRNMKKLMIIY